MNDNRKISEIYFETINAIDNLKINSTDEEKEELFKTINKNKTYLGFDNFEAEMLSYGAIKDLELAINKNIRIAKEGTNNPILQDLQELIKEEPEFLEQFNF